MMVCADTSNSAKPLPTHQYWLDKLIEEFFNQGDTEREQGLEISPMCDRNSVVSVEKLEVCFFCYQKLRIIINALKYIYLIH